MNSVFSIGFGEIPNNYISREKEYLSIIDSFESYFPEFKTFAISGPRGCGKTVLLSYVKKYFDNIDNWITVDLNPFSDMLEQLAAKLYEKGKLKKIFIHKEFSFSFHGISFSINGDNPISNVDSLLEIMMKHLQKKKIRILITIDDIATNDNVKKFVYTYQSFLREGFSTFLIMTGLYENISKLENVQNLTFLLRTPKIILGELNMRAIANSYQQIFDIELKEAIELAKLTKGYAYAYQLLGSLLNKYNSKKVTREILNEFDLKLEENVYAKIWSSLSENEKNILYAMIEKENISFIVEKLNMSNASLQTYKKRLYKQGIVNISKRGIISYSLPRFKEFVAFQKELNS